MDIIITNALDYFNPLLDYYLFCSHVLWSIVRVIYWSEFLDVTCVKNQNIHKFLYGIYRIKIYLGLFCTFVAHAKYVPDGHCVVIS